MFVIQTIEQKEELVSCELRSWISQRGKCSKGSEVKRQTYSLVHTCLHLTTAPGYIKFLLSFIPQILFNNLEYLSPTLKYDIKSVSIRRKSTNSPNVIKIGLIREHIKELKASSFPE